MNNFFNIIFGISFNYKINFIGDLYYSHIFVILSSLYFFLKKEKYFYSNLEKKIFFLGILWLINQLISDFINQTQLYDIYKGNIKIIITLLSFFIFFRVAKYGLFKIINLFIWITLIFLIIKFLFNFNLSYNWKFGIGLSLTYLLILFNNRIEKNFKFNRLLLLLIFIIGIFSLFVGTRYIFLFNTIFLIIIFLTQYLKKIRPISLIIILIVSSFLIVPLYSKFIKSDLIEADLSQKFNNQASGDLGPLVGGRTEILSSIKAISDKPIFGHGSWPRNCEYLLYLDEKLLSLNYQTKLNLNNCLIPTHSVIFGSWVQSGIFGFIFWLYIIFYVFKSIKNILLNKNFELNRYSNLVIYLSIVCIWDILFSPFGANRMIILPLYLVIIFGDFIKKDFKTNKQL